RIFRKDRVGLIGPNGAGKTTLLRLLIVELEPDTGTVKLDANLLPVVIDHRRTALDPDKTPWEILADRNDHVLVRGTPKHVMTYLREYLFRDEQARQPVRTLSGGERNRLLLAKALAAPSNMLVLDEPTNDLDADTLDLLQEALSDYDGTVLLVSHDRDFLDRLVTSTIALEGDGTAIEYAGGYSDYLVQRGPREAPATIAPRKAKAELREAAPARRLGYKRERALAGLPQRIDALHAKDAAYRLERESGVAIDWLPYILDIPAYLGSAKVDAEGRVLEQDRNAHQWRRVRYSYRDVRREANRLGLTIRGTQKIWNSSLAGMGLLYAKRQGAFPAYNDE